MGDREAFWNVSLLVSVHESPIIFPRKFDLNMVLGRKPVQFSRFFLIYKLGIDIAIINLISVPCSSRSKDSHEKNG